MGLYPLCHQFKYLDYLGNSEQDGENEKVSTTTRP